MERQVEKCEVCNENEYIDRIKFKYKKWEITTRVCIKCKTVLMSDEFARYRTIVSEDIPKVKILRRK